jgi:predicted AAA+ superfamily ATPase
VYPGIANIITGARRCGKSVLAFQLAKRENFGYVNF